MSTPVQEAVDEYLAAKRHLRARTLRWYVQKLEVFSKWCKNKELELDDIKAKQVRAFIDSLSEDYSDYTRHGYAQVIKGFLSWCSQDEDYEDDVNTKVLKRIEMPKVEKSVIHTFTADEVKRLFQACELEATAEQKAKAKAIISVLLDTGIRASEICYDSARPQEDTAMRLSMIDLDPKDSHIVVFGKGNKQREVGLGDSARRALKRYISYHRKSSSDFVFIGRGEEPLTVRGMEMMLSRLATRAKIQECYPHKFRHTFAVNYLLAAGNDADGAALYRLMRLMGHTDIKTTTLYLRALEQRQIRTQYSVLDNLKKF
jgi:integrase/recombinase XerD